MDVSFVLLQGVLALEPLAAAFRLANEPSISFAGLLVLLKAEEKKSTASRVKFFLLNQKVLRVADRMWANRHHPPGLRAEGVVAERALVRFGLSRRIRRLGTMQNTGHEETTGAHGGINKSR